MLNQTPSGSEKTHFLPSFADSVRVSVCFCAHTHLFTVNKARFHSTNCCLLQRSIRKALPAWTQSALFPWDRWTFVPLRRGVAAAAKKNPAFTVEFVVFNTLAVTRTNAFVVVVAGEANREEIQTSRKCTAGMNKSWTARPIAPSIGGNCFRALRKGRKSSGKVFLK